MKTIQINLYSFDELSKEVQNNVIENNRYINADGYKWSEYIEDQWIEKLNEMGFVNPKILFTGFGNQGDGACFTSDWFDVSKVLNNDKYNEFTAKITHSWRYYYASSTSIDISSENDNGLTDVLSIEAEESISKLRTSIGNKIYEDLEKYYNDITSDKAIIDTFKDYEYTFEKDGTIRNED